MSHNLKRFAVYSNDILVGYTNLEKGDPPMGVAFGAFVPVEAYELIKNFCLYANVGGQIPPETTLSIRMKSGVTLDSVGGVVIMDFSEELEGEAIEVSVLGISYPLYGELFPEHVLAYDKQFC